MAWLGDEDANTNLAFELIEGAVVTTFPSRNRWRDLQGILSRPYWQRIWIIQELALIPDVVVLCGMQETTSAFWQTHSVQTSTLVHLEPMRMSLKGKNK